MMEKFKAPPMMISKKGRGVAKPKIRIEDVFNDYKKFANDLIDAFRDELTIREKEIKKLKLITSESGIINSVDDMCLQSLPPELFEQWEKIRVELFKNRKLIK